MAKQSDPRNELSEEQRVAVDWCIRLREIQVMIETGDACEIHHATERWREIELDELPLNSWQRLMVGMFGFAHHLFGDGPVESTLQYFRALIWVLANQHKLDGHLPFELCDPD